MKGNPLVKELFWYSWLVALITGAFAFMFVYIFRLGKTPSLFYSAFVGTRCLVLGLINIGLLLTMRKVIPVASATQEKVIRYFLGYLLGFVFFVGTTPVQIYLSPQSETRTFMEQLPSILFQAAISQSMVVIVHNLVILRYEKTSIALENSRLKAASLESANLLLKQQIHPHFLFNALSMLKSLYKSDLKAGEAYLSHLVNFLRVSLTEPQSSTTRLSDEIRLCNDYLEMQKIRFEDALICNIQIPEDVLTQGAVPSFSIQSLIENAIKHNEITESSPLVINVFYKEGRIFTANNLQVKTVIDGQSGKGLINLIERYRILSGDEVIIRQDENTFSVGIKVLSNERSDHRR